MQIYILRRLIFFLPGLVLISMLVFYLSAKSPLTTVSSQCNNEIVQDWSKYRLCLQKSWEDFGLNKPLMYFSFRSLSEPDTLYLIFDQDRKNAIHQLIHQYGNWPEVQSYFQSIAQLEDQHIQIKLSSDNFSLTESNSRFKAELISLRRMGSSADIQSKLEKISALIHSSTEYISLAPAIQEVKHRFEKIQTNKSVWKNYVPIISWQGFDNRYHNWISKAIRLDWGNSYSSKSSINDELNSRFGVTFSFALFNALIVYLLSIPLGLWAARYTTFDRISKNIFFVLASIPGFWLAILLRLFFANPHIPEFQFFPSEYKDHADFFGDKFLSMVLPLIVYSYGSLAVLSRITRNSLLEVSHLDFMRTVRAKGLSESRAYWRHALPNAILPNISLLIYIFPAMFSGSVIIEDIFNISGIGKYIFEEIHNNNTPVILAVFSIIGFLTLLGYLISDILSFWADPRINRQESINSD